MSDIPLEGMGWSLLALLAPLGAEWSLKRWGTPRIPPEGRASAAVRWVSNILPLWAALLTGGVLLHHVGLQPQSLRAWLVGAGLVGFVLALAFFSHRKLLREASIPEAFAASRNEARWMLYRAGALAWTGNLAAAVGVGLLVGALEWPLYQKLHANRHPNLGSLPGWLLHVAVSGLIFGLTQNAILTLSSSFLFLLFAGERS